MLSKLKLVVSSGNLFAVTSASTAFTIFAKKVTKERRIPFEITADPFYSEANMRYLDRVIADIESGKAKLTEHELIEDS